MRGIRKEKKNGLILRCWEIVLGKKGIESIESDGEFVLRGEDILS